MDWMGLEMAAWESAGCRPKDKITRALFRHQLQVPDGTGKSEIRIACVNRYRLSVNGCTIMHGPARAPQMQCFFDAVDLSNVLKTGLNELEIEVEAYPSQPETPGHEGPQCFYRYDRGPMISVASERFPELSDAAAWKVIPDTGYAPRADLSLLAGPAERIDFGKRKENALQAVRMGAAGSNPWGEIVFPEILPKPFPNLLHKHGKFHVMPVICAGRGETKVLVLELDALKTAVPAFEISGGKGAEIRFLYAESYVREDQDGDLKGVRSDRSGVLKGIEDVVFPCGGEKVWEPLWFRAFRYLQITVRAEGSPVTVRPLGVTELRYPLKAHTTVTAPEKWVGQLFQMSRRTLENCMHDSYEDCPYYEQLQYIMDTRLEALYTHRLSGDTRLSRQAIRLFAASQTSSGLLQARYPCAKAQVIPEFSLFFLEMLLDDYEQTGDSEFVRSFLPTVWRIMDAFLRNVTDSGMFGRMGWWEFADWTPEWNATYGTPTAAVKEESALHNLHFAYALRCFSRLLNELGETEQAQKIDRTAGRIATAVHHACYDLKRQMYREGRTTQEFSQHTQIWAVLCGLAEGELAQHALTHALNDSDVIQCSFCMQYYLFRALEKAGMYEKTMPLWDSWKQLIEQDLTTIPENPGQPRSDCHGWGAVPLYEFPAVWLGVNPGMPGWKKILITPRTDLIPNLSGTCCTPNGPVFVSWTRKSSSVIHLWIQAPPDTDTEVRLPDGQEMVLSNGSFDGEVRTEGKNG